MLKAAGRNLLGDTARRLCAAFPLACLLAAPLSAERLPVKTYTVADGLQRDSVFRIRQDSRGFLWFCTAEGVSGFDGVGMTNFTVADGLPDRVVYDFLETKNGAIYVATGAGLARLNPNGIRDRDGSLFTVFLPDNPKAEKILTLYEDKNRQVWVGTSDGFYRLIETGGSARFENVPLGEPLKLGEIETQTIYITAILADRRGTLWVGTHGSGLFRLPPDGGVRRFTTADGFGDNKITGLLEDRDGRLWMSMRSDESGGVCLLDAAAAGRPVRKCYTTKDGLGSNWIRGMLETSDGQMWLATVAGLCRWQGAGGAPGRKSVCQTYTAKNNLCDDLYSLAEDKDGNLWTGSRCGAQKIARYGFTTYDQTDGLESARVNSIFENSAGELFATAFPKTERVISRFDADKFSLVKPRLPGYVNYHGWGWRQTVRQDRSGAWWIPTGHGLFRSPDNTSFENLARAALEKIETGAKALEIYQLFEDSRGDIWLLTTGAAHELLRWERATNVWHDYTPQVGFSVYRVGSAMVEDRGGNIWIGASSNRRDGALIRYRGGRFRVFTEAEGAPSGWIRDLFLDSRGRLWIASTNDGLWRLDDTDSDRFGFVKYTPAEGLTSAAISCVTEDEFGRIYVGTWRGVDRLDPDTGQVENFTAADGLPASFVETAYRDRQNNLWFGTHEGLARFVPEPPRTREPPTILITGVRVEGEARGVSVLGETEIANLELDASQRQISVDFLGSGASLGEKLKYEYRLGDSEWSQTAERTINFANLAAGAYRFQVRAQTADRIYSRAPAVLYFRVAAPLWQRPWFVLLAAALAALLIHAFYRSRLKRLLEMERVRTRIATDLHDDIGANLTKIAILSEVAKQQLGNGDARPDSPLSSIARISRESVASMSDIVWAINPRRDSLLDLVRRMRQHAEEIFVTRGVELGFDATGAEQHLKLGVDVRRDLFLIFKEAVNNVARHSSCSRVAIDFRAEGSWLALRIADDGVGFDPSVESEGQGLASMSRRARGLGGSLAVLSRAGGGTTVKLRLPAAHRAAASRDGRPT
jgi:ligand-binding sensor domain-containing protein/two-component sensor histidine kinase